MAAVLSSASAANATDSPTIIQMPHAWSLLAACRVVEVLVPGQRGDAGMGLRVGGDRPRPARDEDRLVDAGGGVTAGELVVEHDVAEPGGAVVDGRDAQRLGTRVGHPGTQRVADAQAALGGDHAADRDRAAAHVAQAAGRDVEVERPCRSPSEARRPATACPSREPSSSRNSSVGSMPAAARTPGRRASAPAVPAGSGAPSAPTTTWSAVTRASVTRSVSSCELACSTPWVPTSMAISTTGVASAAVRQRLAARPVLASRPGAPRSRSGSDSAAAGQPEQPAPEHGGPAREQDAAEDRERERGLAREDASPSRCRRPGRARR